MGDFFCLFFVFKFLDLGLRFFYLRLLVVSYFFWFFLGGVWMSSYIFFSFFFFRVYISSTLPSIMGRGVGLRGLVGFLHFPRSFFIFSSLWRTIPRN